jgi:uncharacterized membrane protein YfcA
MWELLLPVAGFLIGIVAAMAGVGGGVFIVPLLALAFSFSPAHAVGTSLTVIVFTAVAATVSYSRQKRVYYKIGLLLAVLTVPGAVLGAYLTSVLPASLLGLIFGVFLVLVAVQMVAEGSIFRKNGKQGSSVSVNSEAELCASKNRLVTGVLLAFFGGLASGLLGIGGGAVLVPIMVLVLMMPIHIAVATSMFTMILTSLSGVAQHYALGNVNLEFALLIAVGSVLGAQLGAYTSKRVSGKNLRRIFAVVLIIVSAQMIIKFI